jgi:hypothetical protein
MPKTRHVCFVLTNAVERALIQVLHDVEAERGRRVTWDQAFRQLLEMASRPVQAEPDG